jgi:DNA-binding response OmpR family regulator
MPFKPKILLVESDAATLQLLESSLKTMPVDLRCVGSGAEASSLIEREKFDGAFVDWDNSDLLGEELTRRIRRSKSNATIPIAMLTSRSDAGVMAEGFKAGVTLFLAKPFGVKELERLLNVTRSTMQEERRRYQRVPLTVPVICEWGQKRGHKRMTGKTINVSRSGLLMRLFPYPDVGAAVSMVLMLPGSRESLTLKGVIPRVGSDRQVAVQFVGTSKEQYEVLESFVSRDPNDDPNAATVGSHS